MTTQFYIVNKSGGLIYSLPSGLTINSAMVLCSTLHSVNLILLKFAAAQKSNSVVKLHMGRNIITLYKTATNTTFILVGTYSNLVTMRSLHRMYIDYVLKDPFYVLDMPIKSELFDPKSVLEEIL